MEGRHINFSRDNDVVYVELKGSISFLTADEIRKRIYDFLNQGDKTLMINLSKVDFIDSAGLGLLITFLKYMKDNGGEMVVEYPKLGVQKLLEMSRMDELFEIKKTPEPTTGSWNEFM